jgi:hypothetical protein
MSIAHLCDLRVPGDSDALAKAAARNCSGIATIRTQPRVTPLFAFEAEEFNSQFPDEDWRLRLGLPQTLDFPSVRG